jgi:hypothetical protein
VIGPSGDLVIFKTAVLHFHSTTSSDNPIVRWNYSGPLALATMAGYEQIHSRLHLLLITLIDWVRRGFE